MTIYWLQLRLKSDTTFGRGDGVAGLVDAEVQHDANGLPYLSGKTLKGLLAAVCAEIMDALALARVAHPFAASAERLFGRPGSKDEAAVLHVGDARLPDDLRQAIAHDVYHGKIEPADVLASLTTLRRQTAMNAETGAPRDDTLRTMRVIVHDLPFVARLDYRGAEATAESDLPLLAACALGLRRAGSGRNRGRGRIQTDLFLHRPQNESEPATKDWFDRFEEALAQ